MSAHSTGEAVAAALLHATTYFIAPAHSAAHGHAPDPHSGLPIPLRCAALLGVLRHQTSAWRHNQPVRLPRMSRPHARGTAICCVIISSQSAGPLACGRLPRPNPHQLPPKKRRRPRPATLAGRLGPCSLVLLPCSCAGRGTRAAPSRSHPAGVWAVAAGGGACPRLLPPFPRARTGKAHPGVGHALGGPPTWEPWMVPAAAPAAACLP